METAWAYIKKGAGGSPSVERGSHTSITAVRTNHGDLIVTFPELSRIFTCVATPGKIFPVRPDIPILEEDPHVNYPRSIAAAPGDQAYLAPNQVRVQFHYEESEFPGSYELNLAVWGDAVSRDTFYVQGRHL